jgi:hypothetical protein
VTIAGSGQPIVPGSPRKHSSFHEPMETGTGPQTKVDMVSDLLEAHDKQLVAHARRELRMGL